MGKLSLIQKMVSAYQRNEPMPLEGRTKITIRDGLTGHIDNVVESKNMVTNAVADILAHNPCGLINVYSVLPLRNFYGGVLCFENPLTENVNNYNPPADTTNKMIAHAGQTSHSTASPYRGNPNGGESVIGDTSWKMVWDWSTNQGVGTISSVCLCPNELGNMGLKPFDNTMTPIRGFGNNDNTYNADFNESIGKMYPIDIDDDGQTSYTTWLDGANFRVHVMRHDYWEFGIMRDMRTWQELETKTATIRTGGNRFVFCDANYFYVAAATSATGLRVDKISRTDMTVTTNDMTYSGISLYTGGFTGLSSGARVIFPFDGTYLYFPNSTRTGFYRLSLADTADVELLNGTLTVDVGRPEEQLSNGAQYMHPIVISPRLIVGGNYIINGSNVYPIARPTYIGSNCAYSAYGNFIFPVRKGASVYGHTKNSYSDSYTGGQAAIKCTTLLTTINNLEEPVNKSTSQVMKIEYTISEV